MKTTVKEGAGKTVRPEQIFSAIANERGAVWLDSSLMIAKKGRYSFIARNPVCEISATIENIERSLDKIESICLTKKLFAVGFLSYEAGVNFLEVDVNRTLEFPALHFFLYESALKHDHSTGSYESTNPSVVNYEDLLHSDSIVCAFEHVKSPKYSETVTKETYLRRVKRIKEHIKEGDIYQANYTCRFDVNSDAKPFTVYQRLRELNPAPYAAYLNFGDYQILSSSPERMFNKENDTITSCPIKGTVPASTIESENDIQRKKLLCSDKDKAELLMIVDLMRNDLGKIAKTGTVEVNNLFTPETYSSVIHLVADVTAEIKEDVSMSDLLKALIPGGSITGAPKKRAVEILQTFETTPRNVYTGCIGYIDGKNADFNIAIRTILHRDNCYHIHAGGGIVADSEPESEFIEMHLKARNLFRALGVSESDLNG